MPFKCDYVGKELLILAGDEQIISRNNFEQPLLFPLNRIAQVPELHS